MIFLLYTIIEMKSWRGVYIPHKTKKYYISVAIDLNTGEYA